MNEFFKSVKNILLILPSQKKRKLPLVILFLFLQSSLELIGLGAIIPVLLSIFDQNFQEQNKIGSFLFNYFDFTNREDFILFLTLALLFLNIFKNTITVIISRYCNGYSFSIYKNLAIRIHKKYYDKGYLFFKSTNSSEIWRDINQATFWFGTMQVMGFLNILNESIILIMIFSAIILYDFNVAIIILFIVPFFSIFYSWIKKRSISLGEERKTILPELTGNYYQSIHGFSDISVNNKQEFFRGRIKRNINNLINVEISTAVNLIMPSKVLEVFIITSISSIIFFGLKMSYDSNHLISTLSMLAIAGYRLTPSINKIVNSLNSMSQTNWVYKIIFENLSKGNDENVNLEKISFKEKIILKDISFKYPANETETISKFNLEIKKGETLGIKGRSGSGKTTLIKILLGLINPTQGNYIIDNTNISSINIDSLRGKIGYVSQDIFLIDGTVIENVAFGIDSKNVDLMLIEKALKHARMWDVVCSFSSGLKEEIGENGVKLSGGQRQRIGIARALYKNAEIFIFDEATSALDDQTEHEINNSIKDIINDNITFIIIAHRKSSLIHCNRIIEIDKLNLVNT